MMTIEVDAALGGPIDKLGKMIEAAGETDSSGLRRHLVHCLGSKDFDSVITILKITADEAKALRQTFVDVWGEPCGGTEVLS